MSANKELKKDIVAEIVEKVKSANSIVLVNYQGLTVEQDTELRNKFRASNVDYKVYKNRLLKIAFFLFLLVIADWILLKTNSVK